MESSSTCHVATLVESRKLSTIGKQSFVDYNTRTAEVSEVIIATNFGKKDKPRYLSFRDSWPPGNDTFIEALDLLLNANR